MKFAAMVSVHRAYEDKLIDGRDFIYMVKKNSELDPDTLQRLGELVYSGGGKEILKLVADARAGKRLEF